MPETEEGRITLAILGSKLDRVLLDIGEIKAVIRPDHDALLTIAGIVAAHEGRLNGLDTRVDRVDSARKWEGRMEALVAGIVAAGAWFRP